MKLCSLAGVAVATMLTASGAGAQGVGWYGAIDFGAQHKPSWNGAFNAGAPPPFQDDPRLDFHTATFGYAGFARIGYRFNRRLRAEMEVGYRHGVLSVVDNAPDTPELNLCNTNSPPGACYSPVGTETAWTGMANGLYDLFPSSRFDPFIGFGLGVMHVRLNANGNLWRSALDPLLLSKVDSSATRFSYQGIAGVSYRVNRRLNIDLTYRYLTGLSNSYTLVDLADHTRWTLNGRYEDHALTLGLRYAFAAAPPTPPPPPAPPPQPPATPPPSPPPPPAPPPPPPPPPVTFVPRDFVVYFPWDQYVITPEAQSVLREAAGYAGGGHAKNEAVVGYTDASGSAAYNLRLSERRSKATADALVALGVPQASLDVSWKGESDPAVPTDNGVKEPLNRRATIHIAF